MMISSRPIIPRSITSLSSSNRTDGQSYVAFGFGMVRSSVPLGGALGPKMLLSFDQNCLKVNGWHIWI